MFAEDEARLLRAAAAEEGALERMVRRRTAGEFLEHVLGAVEIFGERLSVGPGVFVPRQRTALLIERTLDACRGRAAPTVLEACCGVAPIAALVARRHPSAQVHAMDRDETALRHAQKNLPASARTHRAESLAGLPPPRSSGGSTSSPPCRPTCPRGSWRTCRARPATTSRALRCSEGPTGSPW
ncbi:Uncharacterized methylase SCO7062 [Brachybacterium faecium]|nr:Uncharacterized methylase SCO7062 [Brachybacterium faecium]